MNIRIVIVCVLALRFVVIFLGRQGHADAEQGQLLRADLPLARQSLAVLGSLAALALLALLQPLAGLHMLSWNWQGSVSQSDIDEMQARNMQTTMSTVAASIAKAVQQRAEEAGIPCTVNVEMANDADGLLQVDKVTVYYDSTAANRLSELQSLLTKECGVPAERQEPVSYTHLTLPTSITV